MKIPDDPFIRELLPEFVETWIKDINEQFDDLILTKNSEVLHRLAHTLKGSCFQFGLDEVGEMGVKLMEFAKEGQWKEAESMKNDLLESFKEAQEFLEKLQ